jgi:hypothetical protein
LSNLPPNKRRFVISFETEERRRDFLLKIISILPVLTGKTYRFSIEKDKECLYFTSVQQRLGLF